MPPCVPCGLCGYLAQDTQVSAGACGRRGTRWIAWTIAECRVFYHLSMRCGEASRLSTSLLALSRPHVMPRAIRQAEKVLPYLLTSLAASYPSNHTPAAPAPSAARSCGQEGTPRMAPPATCANASPRAASGAAATASAACGAPRRRNRRPPLRSRWDPPSRCPRRGRIVGGSLGAHRLR